MKKNAMTRNLRNKSLENAKKAVMPYRVLGYVGLALSTFYENINRKKSMEEDQIDKAVGRPQTLFSYALNGKKIPNEQIKEWLCELVCGDGFPYGYKKFTAALVDDYALLSGP